MAKITDLVTGAVIWVLVQDVIKLSRANIEEDRSVLLKEVLILVAIVIGLMTWSR